MIPTNRVEPKVTLADDHYCCDGGEWRNADAIHYRWDCFNFVHREWRPTGAQPLPVLSRAPWALVRCCVSATNRDGIAAVYSAPCRGDRPGDQRCYADGFDLCPVPETCGDGPCQSPQAPPAAPAEGAFVARIVRTPFVYPDGELDVATETVREPRSVHLDGSWLHIREPRDGGDSDRTLVRGADVVALQPTTRRVRSYPLGEIQFIDWVENP